MSTFGSDLSIADMFLRMQLFPTTSTPKFCQMHSLRNRVALFYDTMVDLQRKARSSFVDFSNAPLPLYPAVNAHLVYYMSQGLVGIMVQTGTPVDTCARVLRLLEGFGTSDILFPGDAFWVTATVKEKDWKRLLRLFADLILYPIVL